MNKIDNTLAKFGWKTRRWNIKFDLLNFKLGNKEEWGFELLTLKYKYRSYSLLKFFISMPNRTTRQKAVIEEWDILWFRYYLWRKYDRLTDDILWSRRKPTNWESIQIWILEKIFL
jgi:hypothetical protein